MDKFPAISQLFDFEDKTLPVHIRQFSDNAEMYQIIQSTTISLIKLQKVSAKEVEVNLYVGSSLYSEKIQENYPKLIKGCFDRV